MFDDLEICRLLKLLLSLNVRECDKLSVGLHLLTLMVTAGFFGVCCFNS